MSGKWTIDEAERTGDMHPGKSLHVCQTADGDIILSILDHDGMPIGGVQEPNGIIEFSTVSGGGGKSGRTRAALVALMHAMKEDASEDPEGTPVR